MWEEEKSVFYSNISHQHKYPPLFGDALSFLFSAPLDTICAGPGGATAAWSLEPDILVIGKPIGGGMPVAAYGLSEQLGELIATKLTGDDIDVSGIGGTLTGNSMALAAVRAALSNALRECDFEKTIPLATAWVTGVRQVIEEYVASKLQAHKYLSTSFLSPSLLVYCSPTW